MESGQQLASPSSAPCSLHMVSSSASTSPAPTQIPSTKCSPVPSLASSSTLTTSDHLVRVMADKLGSSNGFPLVSHPTFGFYTSNSGHSEFGGLGNLALSSLTAHSQFGTFPDWWRPSEAPTRGAFFPPLLGLHPVFASTFKGHDPVQLQSLTSGVNGRSDSSPAENSAVNTSSFPAKGNRGKTKASSSWSQNNSQHLGQLHQKTVQKTKQKKPNKPPLETSSMSGSQTGSLSGSSSDCEESSGDPDDMEEVDSDEDGNDQSNDSEESDSDKEDHVKHKVERLTQNTSESKKKRPSTTVDSHCDSVPLTSSYCFQSSSHSAGQLQTTGLFLQSPSTAEEGGQQHISVIQPTGLVASNNSLAQSHRKASTLLPSTSPKPISFFTSPKHFPPSTSPKHSSHSSSPKHSSASSSPKPLNLCSPNKTLTLCSPKLSPLPSPKPLTLSSVPKPPALLMSQKASHKPNFLLPSPKHTQPVYSTKESSGNLLDESSLNTDSLKFKQTIHSKDSFRQPFPLRPTSQNCNDTNLLLNHHRNGETHSEVQDAPLALISKPHNQSTTPNRKPLLAAISPPYIVPVNLSTGTKELSGNLVSQFKSLASSGLPHKSRTTKTLKYLHAGKHLPNTSCAPVDLVRGSESDIHSSKGSDDSLGDDLDDEDEDDDDIEDEDSGSSLSESECNLESGSDGSDDIKDDGETEADNDAKRAPLIAKSLSTHKSPLNLSANSSLLNLQIIKPTSDLLTKTTLTSPGAFSNHCTPSPSFTFATQPGSGKRRRVTDESVLQLPLKFGWRRETRIRTVASRLQGEVAYFAPCGKKMRQYPDVIKYLLRNGITEISRDNFSFSTKIKVGDFYEAREGPEGLQWFLLAEEEIASSIIAMDGRHNRRPKAGHETTGDATGGRQWKDHHLNISENNFQDVRDAKMLRKLEAQEIARQAAQIKLMRKLEKQAMVQAAKEARKQQAIMAAEERRKKREQMKILKQQEKIKRIQQIRIEKERRAQQILEAKRKKKEAAVSAKILEAEKRNKEKEMRRLQAVILKHQERERRKQHLMLMKAVEARKKAEEKERLKKEKKDEKRLNKERKLELRRLELEKAKELKKPNEDMCLADHKPLPPLSRIPGLVLPGNTFSECLMVLQFLRSFGKVLGLDINSTMLNLSNLQAGLLNIGDSMGKVQDLVVSMLSAAVCDPGIPAGHKSKTSLGDHLTNVEINRDNVSEILQIYMEGHCEQTQLVALAHSLRTKPFQAHSPSQKASILAFLVNELCTSKTVISEIDKNIDHMTNLRKDKWVVEGKLRKLRNIHAKKTGKRDCNGGGEDSHTFVISTSRNKCKRKEGESEDEEDEDEDSEDQGDDEEEEEEEESGVKKVKKTEICEEEDDSVHSASVEELEKQIEKTYKQQSQIRQKLLDSSHSLRSMMIGQDRYKRRYWVLPQCGGIFVEGMESDEGYEQVEKEKKQPRMAQVIGVKEEQLEETKKPVVPIPAQSKVDDTATSVRQQDQERLNLFLQKPDSLSKLSKLLQVATMTQDSNNSHNSLNSHSAKVPATISYPSNPSSQREISHSSPPATSQQELNDKAGTSMPLLHSAPQLKSSPWTTCSPQYILHDEHLSKILMEKSSQWFSLLPRSPCDESSVISGSSPTASSSSPQTISTTSPPSSSSPNSLAIASYNASDGISNLPPCVLQQEKSGSHQSRVTQDGVSRAETSPSLPFPGTSLHPMIDLYCWHTEGNENRVHFLANNNSVNNSETPEAATDKPLCASLPAVEVAKTQDYSSPQPIPGEMLHGWWKISDTEELDSLVKTLNSRGIREKILQKQIQKHMEYMTQLCTNCKDEVEMAEKQEVSQKIVESWCIQKQAMEVDISLLQQVEDLERKVISSSLQVKGWMHSEPQSERKDLVYHEHKLFSSPASDNKGQRETNLVEPPGTVVRRSNNPLDLAVIRLTELERHIQRSSEEEVATGLRLWHKALSEVRSSAQLSLCIQKLQKSIAWERSIIKVHCQLCQKGDNEELLLLCDGCDKGCHTYCHYPKITTVPDGDWFCPTCVAKESGQSPRSRKQQSQTAGGGKKGGEVKRNGKPSVVGELIKVEAASSISVPRKGTKKRKRDDSPASSEAKHDSPVSCAKKAKTAKDNINELVTCRMLLAELEAHQDAWPFLSPVNHKAVPGYRKVIKKPMDFSTIREKLANNQYLSLETFIVDVNLVFDNCERFNEDNSEIGRAGHNMRRFFDKRWTELLK